MMLGLAAEKSLKTPVYPWRKSFLAGDEQGLTGIKAVDRGKEADRSHGGSVKVEWKAL